MSSPAISPEIVVIDQGPIAPAKSWGRQVWERTFSDRRAIAGAIWIVILAALAVFAPFLASSHPLLMKSAGHWSSPLLHHLTPADLILVATTVVAVLALLIRRWLSRKLVWCLLAALAVVWVAAIALVHPPEAIVFEQYRDAARAGQIQWALDAIIPYSPTDRMRDVPGERLHAPSREHWLGTEVNGADVLSGIIHASRIAMAIGFISTSIAVLIGVVVGGIMGFFVAKVDILGMRVIEIVEAIPTLFLLITVVALFGRNLYLLMAIIGMTSWTGNARFIRAEFLRLRNQDFVQAAIATGLPLRSVLFRHMLPNGVTPVLISASFGIASAILAETTLSFLGLGLVDEQSWGKLLNQALSVGGTFTWWLALYPGLAIFLTVYAYNLVGESLRDALDPKLHGA